VPTVTAVQLADRVWRIPTAPADFINSYLLEDDDGSLTLVDAGLFYASRKVLAALEQVGKRPGDVQRILLTHAHVDHAGGLARTQRATGGRVLAHEAEAPYLQAGQQPPSGSRLGRLLDRLPGGGFRPVEVADTFADGAVLPIAGGLTVVHTPGHSPGHCSFLHTPSGVLITGDALFNVRGLRYSPKTFCTDVGVSRETAARLGELDYEVAAFTHGAEVRTGTHAAVRAFLQGRSS
jgi:glyoxylase-like metal-dependent hydrolase (beta-lactamase superfamily II)